MRLLQLNLWEGRLIRHIPDYIKRVDPDIVCLQEVFSSANNVPKPSRMLNSLQQIQAVCGYQHEFLSPTFSAVYAGVKVDYGNAILSRYPLLDMQTIFVSGEYCPELTSADSDDHIRNLQIARVQAPAKDFVVANHHGSHAPDGYGDESTVRKMRLVKKHLQGLKAPLIFAGDLNVTTNTATMAVFDGFLDDLTQAHKVATTLTSLAKPLVTRRGEKIAGMACDHILVSPDVQVKMFRVDDALVSDHAALIFDFEF